MMVAGTTYAELGLERMHIAVLTAPAVTKRGRGTVLPPKL